VLIFAGDTNIDFDKFEEKMLPFLNKAGFKIVCGEFTGRVGKVRYNNQPQVLKMNMPSQAGKTVMLFLEKIDMGPSDDPTHQEMEANLKDHNEDKVRVLAAAARKQGVKEFLVESFDDHRGSLYKGAFMLQSCGMGSATPAFLQTHQSGVDTAYARLAYEAYMHLYSMVPAAEMPAECQGTNVAAALEKTFTEKKVMTDLGLIKLRKVTEQAILKLPFTDELLESFVGFLSRSDAYEALCHSNAHFILSKMRGLVSIVMLGKI
jgi:hypothetical protein